jgi:hypothetical protein
LFGLRRLRLLDEALDLVVFHAGFDVPEAGFRRRGRDAEHHEAAFFSQRHGGADRALQLSNITDEVIGGQNHEDRLGREDGGGRDRGRGVPAFGLEQQGLGHATDLAQLLGGEETVLVVADYDWRIEPLEALQSKYRFLKQGVFGDEPQELLRERSSGQRPKPRSRTAAQDHRNELRHARSL